VRRAASLFCGAGGACLGLRQAGFDVVAGVDFNAPALATYAAAGGHPVQHMITEEKPVPASWVAPLTGLDLLWASPPCQPWSRAGKMKGAEDKRDAWPATIAAVALLRPKWFLGENVRGVEAHLDGYVAPALRALGYVVSWRVLNAADFGVPQTRQRVILVAGPVAMVWPRATHGDPATLRPLFDSRKPWQSMGDALGLVTAGYATYPEGAARVEDRRLRELTDRPSPMIGAMYSGRLGGQPFVVDPKHPPAQPDRPAPTIRSGGSGHSAPPLYVMAGGVAGQGRPKPMSEVSPTVATKGTACLVGDGFDRRALTWQECALLQDFPAYYPWRGGITEKYRQIGNAVPPTLARVLAEAIP
jgi:DNA (cytosine-5)-methyltransferase 1